MKKVLLIATVIAALVGGWFLWGNVHTVVQGELYRSAQLSPRRLSQVINGNNIKSVLNLRGASDSEWYIDEKRVCDSLGVKHENWKLSAVRDVSPQEIDMVLDVIDTMPKPVLVHCEGGADRSGLICAAWLLSSKGVPVEEASGQLSPLYGHLPWLGNPTIAMDHSFDRFSLATQ